MIYCQKPLTARPQLILEGEQESDVHALSIRTAGGLGEGKNRLHGLLNMLKSTQHFPATH